MYAGKAGCRIGIGEPRGGIGRVPPKVGGLWTKVCPKFTQNQEERPKTAQFFSQPTTVRRKARIEPAASHQDDSDIRSAACHRSRQRDSPPPFLMNFDPWLGKPR